MSASQSEYGVRIADAAYAPYFVVELVQGGTLRDWLTHFPPALPDVLQIGCDLADGLVAAARYNLTPVELGLDSVWLERPEQQSATGTVFPIAKLRDFRPLDPHEPDAERAALRSVGQRLHRLLTGHESTASGPLPPVRSLAPRVPAALARLVDGLLADDARHATLASLAEGIRSLNARSQRQISRVAWATTAVLAVTVVAFVAGRHSGQPDVKSAPAPADVAANGFPGSHGDQIAAGIARRQRCERTGAGLRFPRGAAEAGSRTAGAVATLGREDIVYHGLFLRLELQR